jgi:hypothetical protein
MYETTCRDSHCFEYEEPEIWLNFHTVCVTQVFAFFMYYCIYESFKDKKFCSILLNIITDAVWDGYV